MAISKKDIQKTQDRVDIATKDLTNAQPIKFIRKSITVDEKTLLKLHEFQDRTGLDFSSSIRFIVNDYLK